VAEARGIAAATGAVGAAPSAAMMDLMLMCWRAREQQAHEVGSPMLRPTAPDADL